MDDDVNPRIKFDIELDLGGPNDATMRLWIADILRKIADRIEKDEYPPDESFHPVHDSAGKEVGEVYIEYYGHLDHD